MTPKELRAHFAQRVDGLTAKPPDGDLPESEVAGLERLGRLIHLAEAAQPPAGPRRWPFIILGVSIFGILGLLLFWPVSPVEIELDLLVSSVSLTPQEERQVTGLISLRELVSWATLQAPATTEPPGPVSLPPPVALIAPEGTEARLSLAAIDLAPPSKLRITQDEPGRFRLTIDGPPHRAQANLLGPVQVLSRGEKTTLTLNKSAAAYVSVDDGALRLELATRQPLAFQPDLRVSGLELSRDLSEVVEGRREGRSASSVLSGTLYNESMYGRATILRPGEWLTLEGVDGEVRSLRTEDGGLRLRFHGEVEEIYIGSGKNRRSLLPSHLAWLTERQGPGRLWTAAAFLFSLIFLVIRWWKNPSLS